MIDRNDRRTCVTAAWDEIIEFNEKYFRGWQGVDEVFYANALAGEVGEICNAVKHRAGGGTNKSNPSAHDLMDKIVDVFIYLEILVEKMGFDVTSLADAIHTKNQTNTKRMEENTDRNEMKVFVGHTEKKCICSIYGKPRVLKDCNIVKLMNTIDGKEGEKYTVEEIAKWGFF